MVMQTKKYNIAVVIGRFSPTHFAHLDLFKTALDLAEHVIVIIGGYNSPRSVRTPWTAQERADMIISCFDADEQSRIHFGMVEDTLYSDGEWVASVSSSVRAIHFKLGYGQDYMPSICLVAHNKDDTNYINWFKNYKLIDVQPHMFSDGKTHMLTSATEVRTMFFENNIKALEVLCPKPVVDYLNNFKNTDEYILAKEEYDEAIAYDEQYANAPYGYTNFLTVDAMVVQSGHVLLIKRKQAPGRGLWALPGGHLGVNETRAEGAIRELKEETGIKVPDKVLLGSVFVEKVFEHPARSLRCRTKGAHGRSITTLFGYKLDDTQDLPRVVGGDDADKAWWFTFEEVSRMRNVLFEDHFDMIMYGLSRI